MTNTTNGRERSRVGGAPRRYWAWTALFILVLAAAPAVADHPVQVYYLPLPEEEILTSFQALDTSGTLLSGDTSIRTVVSLTVTQTGTIIYYDQWENDFETDISDPDDLYSAGNPGGTQIWGDSDTSNGSPPGIPGDMITAGDVITLDNVVPASPRVSANIFFDGGDKIATTWPIAVTRAAWPVPTTGTVIAGAVEVFPTRDWDTAYQAPVGGNLGVSCTTTNSTDDLADFCMFQDSRLLIMARQDETRVSIDVDNDGNDDISQTLDEGESFTVTGVQAGSVITSTAPVQVNELTGDVGARFEARWFALVPLGSWSDSYLAPVGTVTGTAASRTAFASVVLFNPHSTNLTVNVTTPSGSSPLTVSAGGVAKFIMPGPASSSGAGFTSSDGRTFFALAAADDERSTHDWGHTVLPESSLSIDLKVGWAPGSDGAEISSPVWITARTATTVCADFDDDGVPDQTFPLSAYESLKIYDPDGDQTGLRVFSTTDATCTAASPKNGALLAGAWGQDPFTASTGNPALDLGTTVLQVPPIILAKEGSLAIDLNGNGLVDPGDALRYTIGVLNSGTATATDVTLSDTLDPNTNYIVNTTTRDGVPVPDNSAPATPFPLDEGGLDLGSLGPGVRTEIEFLVEVDPNLPAGTDAIVNRAIVTTGTGETSDDSASAPVFDGNPRVSKISNISGSVQPGDVITYSIAPRNDSPELQTNVEVADTIPTHTTFVSGSASPPQDSGPDPLVWNLGSNVPGTPGSTVGGYLCGEVVDLPATQDTYIEQDSPTADRSTTNPVLTRPETDKVNRALFQFDLSALPAGATVSNAVLTIQSNNTRSGDFADIKRVTTAWTETANWNTANGSTAWGTAGGDFDSTVLGTLTPDASQQQAVITSLVQDWVDGTLSNYGVILEPRGVDDGDAHWESREDGTPERRPFIRAYYTFTSPGGCPSTVQVPAQKDTYIEEDDVTADNSNASTLLTRPQPAGQINRTLYQFSLGTIPADAVIDSAVLTITSRNDRDNHLADVKRVTTFWGETANWNSPWITPGGDFSSVVLGTLAPVGGDAQQTADITALVQDWVDGTLTNYGVLLDPRGTDAGDAQWASSEDGTASRQPFITVTYRSPTVRRTLAVTQDTFINQDNPTQNNGGTDPVQTRPEATKIKRALFQFEGGGIPSNATINSAALLISSANARSNHLANVKHLTSAWTESANWNTTDGSTSWTSAGGDFAGTVYGSFTPVGGDAFGKVDVTPLVQDWVDGTLPNYGVILDPSGSDTGDAQWNSREDGTASRHAFIDVTYLAASLGASTTTAMTAEGTLVSDGDTITVTMELISNAADTNVTPGSLNIAGTNGASVVCGSPSPASQSIAADTPITFVWTCTANAGATPGAATFTAAAAGDSSSFGAASSNNVLVSPLLTFQVTVDDPLDFNVTNIFNTAEMSSDQQPDPNKDTVVDPVDVGAAIGNSVWLDVDGDGIQDVGEDG
ncbi:MAG: DNRLRE domain-containing protein, partial [Thermoanaerobaculia bacterium]